MTRKKQRLMGEINVVPYIDVMLVLLVIFMITAPMLSQGVKVELPQADSTPIPQEEREPLVVTVNGAGEYFMSLGGPANVPLAAAAVPARLQAVLAAQPGLPVYVKGDRLVAYGKVVELMALIQGAGVATVGLMTESPESDNGR
ncbi:MAG: protein TolR [Gammaproteobacteria bacterium]|nr:protein TolR [Gammaproteobacteria bacterium]